MRAFVSFILFSCIATAAFAVGVDEKRFNDPAQEARAQEVMKQIRCLVCQNQSIVDSDATLAKDLRIIIRERIVAGDDDQQILAYMTDRYGEWVLLKPPFEGGTMILWFSPFILLLIGFYIIYRNQKMRQQNVMDQPLTSEEEEQLAELLNNGGEK